MALANTLGGGIILSHLSKSYGHVHAVNSIDLTIAPGETVALLGPNGAGKSTTIDMVLGLTRPDAGSASLFGMSPSQAVAAGAVGGMLQTGSLVPYLRVRELVETVASLYPHPLDVAEVLALSGAAEFADRMTTKLSGGETQRVRFAIALVGDPDLLLLDEPTAALDVEGRRDFWASVRAVSARGKTVIFATHYLEEADAYADRIVVLNRGRIAADGSAIQIKATVNGRAIRATLPDVDVAEIAALPGVISVDRRGDTVHMSSADAEETLRGLLERYRSVRDLEVRSAGLDEAFLALTGDQIPNSTEPQEVR
jgi:ABC-2 type transport system ATP-binding protein